MKRTYPFSEEDKRPEGFEGLPYQIKQGKIWFLTCSFILVGEGGFEPS
jgi:hypothetical protein